MFWSTLSSIIGAATQAAENEKNRKFQAQQASLDREENYYYGERAANNADARSRKLFSDLLSPAAQLRQFKEANLSPSLMFGGSGVGGTSVPNGAQGNGANGIQTNYGANYISPLEGAQTALLTAQAEKVRQETKTIEGNNERGKAEIANIFADIATKGANKELTEAIATGQRLDNALKSETYDYSVSQLKSMADKAAHESQKALWESKSAELDFTIADKTQQEAIKQIENNTKEQLVRIIEIGTRSKLLENQINEIEHAIAQRWDEIRTMQTNAATYADYVDGQKKYWDDWIENYGKGLKVQERGQDIQLGTSIINAGTAVIQSGMNMTGNYMLGQQTIQTHSINYDKLGKIQGSQSTITNKSFK